MSAILIGFVFVEYDAHSATSTQSSIAQKWIDGWNSSNPQKLVDAFTPDGFYQDVPSDSHYKGSSELRELHKFFHDAVGGLDVKLVAAHVSGGTWHDRMDLRRHGRGLVQDRQALRDFWVSA